MDPPAHASSPGVWVRRAALVVVGIVLGLGIGWWFFLDEWAPPPPLVVDLGGGAFVSIGDSYSAGEGLDPWEVGTEDPPAGNRCHRSLTWAYSRLLVFSNEAGRAHLACSGAVVANIYDVPQVHGGVTDPQAVQVGNDVRPDVALVTITIGGNDAGFSRVLKRCFVKAGCPDRPYVDLDGRGYPSLTAWAQERLPLLGERLVELYRRLRGSFPNARILVAGYPTLFPAERPPIAEDPGGICRALFTGWTADERAAIRGWGAELNRVILSATRTADAEIEYVDLASHFAGHEACGPSGPWLRAVGLTSGPVRDGSFHPRRVGQAMIARIVSCHLHVHPTAGSALAGGEAAGFAMAGCVAAQSSGLSEMPPSPSPVAPEGAS